MDLLSRRSVDLIIVMLRISDMDLITIGTQVKKQYNKVPLKKAVDPNEIAEAVLFILNSNSLTGQLINIDGGQHLGWAHADNKKIVDE